MTTRKRGSAKDLKRVTPGSSRKRKTSADSNDTTGMTLSDPELRSKVLQEVRELFDTVSANMLDGLVVLDWDGTVLFANAAAYRIAGLRPRKDPKGLNMVQVLHPDELEHAYANQMRAKEGKGGFLDEFRIVTPRGAIRWIEIIGQKVTFRGSEANLNTFRDITKRKHDEEALRLSEEQRLISERKFVAAFHSGPFPIAISEPATGKIFEVNQAYEELTGYTRSELLGREVKGLRLWANPPDRERYVGMLKRHRKVEGFETMLRRKDGSIRDVILSAGILEVEGKGHLLNIIRDVTEQKHAEEQLRLSEKKFSIAFHANPDAMAITDLKTGRLFDVNRAFEDLTGYGHGDLVGHSATEFDIWAYPEERERLIREIQDRGELSSFETRIRTGSGEFKDVLMSASTIEIGDKPYVLSLAKDITSRKRVEEALRQSEERYRNITSAITDYIYTVYLEGGNVVRTVHSAACEAVTGYSPEDFTQDPFLWYTMVEEEDRESVREHFNRVTTGERVSPIEHRIRRKDGTIRWVSNMPVIHRDASGTMVSYDGVVSDITERKNAEKAIRDRQARLDSIFRVAPTGIGVVANRVLVEVNERICDMTGYSREELVGQSARMLYPTQEDFDYVGAEKYRQISEKGTGSVETRWRRKDGSVIDIILSSTPIDPLDLPAGVTFTALDITERKRAEDALRRSEEKIRGIAINLPGAVYQFYARESGEMGLYFVSERVQEILCIDSAPEGFFERFSSHVAPEDRERFLESIREAVRTVSNWDCEVRYIKPNGEERYIRGISQPERHKGEIVFNGVLLDVTDRRKAENALRESEERYRLMAELTGKLVYDYDVPSGHMTWHGALFLLTGYLPDEFRAKDMKAWNTMIHPEDRIDTIATLEAALHECGLYQAEYRISRKDGSYIHVEDHGVFLADDAGKAYRMLGSVGNITERKKAEEDLRQKTEELDRFFNVAIDLLCIADTHGRFRLLSKAWERVLGYTREELMAGRFFDFIHPDDVRNTEEAVARLATGAEVINFVNRYRCRDGSYRWLEWRSTPAGDLIYAAARDITERRQVEEALRQSEERFRSLIQNSSDIIVILDADGRISYETPSLSRILGYPPGYMLGRSPLEFIHPEDAQFVAKDLGGVYELTNDGRPTAFRFRMADDSWVYLEAVGNNLVNSPGISGVVITARDISERKKAEEHRLDMERRLLHAQRLESLGVMAGGIAHDFNNLLMAILGNLDLALIDLSPVSRSKPFLDNALVAARRAADLTNQMLAYSGKGKFDLKTFDLGELVQEMAHLLKASISKSVTLNLQAGRGLPHIKADPGQIQQIIMNLIVNASEAIGEHPGVVTITTGSMECDGDCLERSRLSEKPKPGTYVFLEVRDTGCGMDEETQARLFDPFFTTKFTGRGLGLAAASGIITGHKGAIMVESQPLQGTSITVLLPVAEENQGAPVREGGKDRRRTSDVKRAAMQGGTVLVVDDEQMVRELCRTMVERLGFTVITAGEGEEALELYREYAPKIVCVILDLTMPRKGGMETFEELKLIDENVRVILSSGFDEEETVHRFEGKGLSGFIKKPYRLEILKTELEKVLRDR